MQTLSTRQPSASRLKRVLLTLLVIILVLIMAAAGALYWTYQRQSATLIRGANLLLSSYGITVLAINGLQTGLQRAQADSIEFLIDDQPAVQHLHSLTLDYELPALLQGQFQQLQVRNAALQLAPPGVNSNVLVDINDITVRCLAADDCSGTAALEVVMDALTMSAPEIGASGLSAAARLDFEYKGPALRLNIPSGLQLTLEQAQMTAEDATALQIEQLSLLSNQTWRLDFDTEQQLLVFSGGQTQIKAPVLRTDADTNNAGLSGLEVNIARLNGSYQLSAEDPAPSWMDRLSTQMGLEISHIYTTLQPFNLWSYRWPVSVQWHAEHHLQLAAEAVTGNNTLARLHLEQNFNTRHGVLQLQTEPLLFSATESLATLLSPLPLNADLVNGQLEIASNIQWQMPAADAAAETGVSNWSPSGYLSVRADNLAGVINEAAFAGLNTAAQFDVQNDLSLISNVPIAVQIGTLNPGFPLENINTELELNTASGELQLAALRFNMFGGTLESDPFAIQLQPVENNTAYGDSFQLRIDNLDISQVLRLSAYDAVSATGLVNGTLPIRLHGFNPVVENGRLHAIPPGGEIRYHSGDIASGNQSLDLVYQALEHYRYELLSANVEYTEAGELTLEMQLQGESPQLNGGQRINLNLNISDNIPALLQSLQAAQSITDRLEELLQ